MWWTFAKKKKKKHWNQHENPHSMFWFQIVQNMQFEGSKFEFQKYGECLAPFDNSRPPQCDSDCFMKPFLSFCHRELWQTVLTITDIWRIVHHAYEARLSTTWWQDMVNVVNLLSCGEPNSPRDRGFVFLCSYSDTFFTDPAIKTYAKLLSNGVAKNVTKLCDHTPYKEAPWPTCLKFCREFTEI